MVSRLRCRLVVLVISLAPFAAARGGKLTFETTGERVSVLLKDWSSKLGLKLAATRSTADDVVALSLNGVPQQEALDRLASVLHASWQAGKGGMFLNRTDRQDREQLDSERKAEVEALRAGQEKIAAALAAQGPFDEAAARKLADAVAAHAKKEGGDSITFPVFNERRDIEAQGPYGRAIAKLRLLVSPEELADLPIGVRVVYSTAPTKLERPLPGTAAEVLREIVEEQATWAEVASVRNLQIPPIWSSPLTEFRPYMGDQIPTRALLCVTRLMHGTFPQFEVILANSHGHVLARPPGVFMEVSLSTPVSVQSTSNAPLILPPDVQAMAETISQPLQPNPGTPVDFSKRLLAPESFDPLSLVAGPALVASAKARNENLVALMSDRFWGMALRLGARRSRTVDNFLNVVRMFGDVEEQNGWLTVSPIEPAYARTVQADRTTLGTYLRARVKQASLSIGEQADYAVALPRERDNSLVSSYLGLILGPKADAEPFEDLLRFYGGLTPEQRSQAEASDGVGLSGLGAESTTDFYRMVFGIRGGLSVDRAIGQGADPDFYFGLGREPTEVLSNGIPPDSRLRVTVKSGFQVMTAANSPSGPTARYLSASEVARLLAQKTRPDVFPRAEREAAVLNHLRFGQSRELAISIDFAPGIHFRPGPLVELISPSDKAVPYADLPADFRAQVDALAAQNAKSFARMQPRPTSISGSTPPPQ